MDTGVSISYLPIPVGIILCFWWGPVRTLPAMYANSLFSAHLWGLHDVDKYPIYCLWEVLAVGISWFFFIKWRRGKSWIPDLRETVRFLLWVAFPAAICNGFLVAGGLVLFGDLSQDKLLVSSLSGLVATLFDTLSVSVPILLWVTPWMEKKGWAKTEGAWENRETSWDRSRLRNLKPKRIAEIVTIFLLCGVFGAIIPSLEYWFVFALFVLWAALRYGITMALTANIWVQIVTLVFPVLFDRSEHDQWFKDDKELIFLVNLGILCVVALITGRATSDSRKELQKRRRIEGKLLQSREQYRKFFEENLSANFITDMSGNILAANSSFLKMFGFETQSEVSLKNFADLFPSYDDYSFFLQKIQINSRLETHEEFFQEKNGLPVHTTGNYFATFNKSGNIDSIRGYLLDDTLRRKLEDQLIESKKLETIGTLAGGIAHDFNNILQIISGYATRMQLESSKFASLLDMSRSINAAAARGAIIVRRLLSLARKGGGGFKTILVDQLINETIDLLLPTFSEKIKFKKEYKEELPTILGDYSQLEQVLINLCLNARDALPEGGEISLRAFAVQGANIRESFPLSEPAEYLCIEISDNGEGMSEETRKRIFEPFFTTKTKTQGSGLGMSMVYGIMQNHEGMVQVSSHLGAGTSIRLFFPVAKTKTSQFIETSGKSSQTSTGIILVVEESPYLSEILKDQMLAMGFRLISADSEKKAHEILNKFKSSAVLTVIDLDFENFSSLGFLETIRRECPELKIFVSGTDFGNETKEKLSALGISDHLEKPYKIRDLIEFFYTKSF
ncbi:ATP-binding protein [Leptospira licerasiae]|uniref:histidine kinase n=1 Tax=Leptospira licerasiae str. MMD4847 TaxID=1049971 RepID=A0ABN0H572_9LEPT|nr:ATP-binding protein [Leptospira licerasiae]EJZ40732.1 PAS domain S-box protein [Leptospira licerasiae str. MMD4847]